MPSDYLDKGVSLKDSFISICPHGKRDSNRECECGQAMFLFGWFPANSPGEGRTVVKLPVLKPDTKYNVKLWSQSCWKHAFQLNGHLTDQDSVCTILYMLSIAAGLVVVFVIGLAIYLVCIKVKRRRRGKAKITENPPISSEHSRGPSHDSVFGYTVIGVRSSSHPQQQNSSEAMTAENTDIPNAHNILRLDSKGYAEVLTPNSPENVYSEASSEAPILSVDGYASLSDIPGTGRLDSEYSRLSHGLCNFDRESRAYQKLYVNGAETKNPQISNV